MVKTNFETPFQPAWITISDVMVLPLFGFEFLSLCWGSLSLCLQVYSRFFWHLYCLLAGMYYISKDIGFSEICRITAGFLTCCCCPLEVVQLADCDPLGIFCLSQTGVHLLSIFHINHSVVCSATLPQIIGTSLWYFKHFRKKFQLLVGTALKWFWSSIYPEKWLCLATAQGKRLRCR